MFDQLLELEHITIKLDRITSMLNMMCEIYFEADKPNENLLKMGYKDYTNVIDTIRDNIIDERANLNDTTNKLYEIHSNMKPLAQMNVKLLEGGDFNG